MGVRRRASSRRSPRTPDTSRQVMQSAVSEVTAPVYERRAVRQSGRSFTRSGLLDLILGVRNRVRSFRLTNPGWVGVSTPPVRGPPPMTEPTTQHPSDPDVTAELAQRTDVDLVPGDPPVPITVWRTPAG